MKARAKVSNHAKRPHPSVRAQASPVAIHARPAANDELKDEKREKPENPLWVINVAMAAFFFVTALVMMIS